MKRKEKIIDVSVAVIFSEQKYLLGYRFVHQHQGERYEFIGGKVDDGESPKQALVREVSEEVGLDISHCLKVQLGIINHHYPDKTVNLHVYHVEVTQADYLSFKDKQYGNLQQPLCWVNKADLLNNKYKLPDANQQILDWLR